MHFQFQFVNSFLALFYTAFYLQDMDKLKEVVIHDKILPQKAQIVFCFSYWPQKRSN